MKGEGPLLHQNRNDKVMDLIRTITDPASLLEDATATPPFGPAFEPSVVQEADRMEVWGTTEEAAEDYTEFRLLKGTQVIGVARIPGY